MFLKKKHNNPEEIFIYKSDCKRSFVRITIPKDEPITAKFNGNEVELFDISANGISFRSNDIDKESISIVEFNLPTIHNPIKAKIEVVREANNSIYYCQFTKIKKRDQEAIHKYALLMQKR